MLRADKSTAECDGDVGRRGSGQEEPGQRRPRRRGSTCARGPVRGAAREGRGRGRAEAVGGAAAPRVLRQGAARGPTGEDDVPARVVLAAHGYLPALLRHAAQRLYHDVRHLERHGPSPRRHRRRRHRNAAGHSGR